MLFISHVYRKALLVAPVGLPSPQTLCRERNGLSLSRGAGCRGDGTFSLGSSSKPNKTHLTKILEVHSLALN